MSIIPQPRQLTFTGVHRWVPTKMGARRKNQIVQDTSWAAPFPQRGNCADLQASRYQLQLLAMQGSQIIPNIKILSDNLNTCATTIQKRNLFHKLSEGLILDGENVSPFWNELSSKLSSGLSLPTATDSALKATNWLSGYASTMQSNSWFRSVQSKSLFRILCPASTASVLGATAWLSTEKKSAIKYEKNPFKKSQKVPPNSILKIPLFPEPELHAIWKQWMAAYRWVYNQCVEFYNSNRVLAEGQSLDQYIQGLQKLPKNQWTKCLASILQS